MKVTSTNKSIVITRINAWEIQAIILYDISNNFDTSMNLQSVITVYGRSVHRYLYLAVQFSNTIISVEADGNSREALLQQMTLKIFA